MRVCLAILFVLLCAVPSTAQTNPVPASQPFNVQFDHDGQNVTGFQCFVDGKPVGSLLATTARVCAIPGQAAGAHTVGVEAINAFGRAGSPSFPVTAGTVPTAPTNLRIVVQVAVLSDGSVTLLASSVSKDPPAAP